MPIFVFKYLWNIPSILGVLTLLYIGHNILQRLLKEPFMMQAKVYPQPTKPNVAFIAYILYIIHYIQRHGMDPMGRAGEGCALRRSVLGRLCMLGSGGVLRSGGVLGSGGVLRRGCAEEGACWGVGAY